MKKIFFAVLSLLIASNAFATVYPMITPRPQFFTSSGTPCSGCLLYVYTAGSSTPKTTYTDSTEGTANSNPIVLNSRGESATGIYFSDTAKFVLKTSGGTTIWTVDNMTPAVGSIATEFDQWDATGLTPTYISSSSFSVSGDQTLIFIVGRRVKITDTSDVNYGRISASSYSGGLTTVTVQLDSGAIDSGISAVSVGLTTPTNPSVAFDSITTGTSAANLTSSGSNTWSGAQVVTGTITSSGANSFSGTQTVTGSINSSATNTWSNTQTITGSINSSATNTWSNAQTITGSINSSATNTFSGTQNVTGAATFSGGLTSSSTTTITGGGNITGTYTGNHEYSGVVTASGGLTSSSTTTISGGGSITGTYAGNHEYSGVVTASGGLTSSGTTTISETTTISGDLSTSGTNTHTGTDVFSSATGTITASMISAATNTAGVTATLKIKILEIGDWDMDATSGVNVAHGLTYSKIRDAVATIRNDADTSLKPFYSVVDGANTGITIDATNVALTRSAGGFFDNTTYDSTSYNRGWIILTYVE